ncbi:uncharacterized protein LAJ45_11500 [Morchella importuna]|uniref:uncharacterized protein n=1 Tax=Morchella importuna TaxID=1174673 RepID=UPI001E8E793B|nr:uncharacterized protein LAJ45_11500 [Morchella importuna]KAH8144489.1 hypothetical protein LAJ45_11500 [Morchella importuna]
MTSHTIYSKIDGRDTKPIPVSEVLADWFGQWLSKNAQAAHPATLRDLLTKVLPRNTWVPFALGDGMYLQFSEENKHIPRDLRFAIVSTPENTSDPPNPDALVGNVENVVQRAFNSPTVCVVASSEFDNRNRFMQVASWDATKRRLNFYERVRNTTGYSASQTASNKYAEKEDNSPAVWHYLGSSFDAFSADTEGRGPFCGHVNGALVMKELGLPWMHWHSTRHRINSTLSPTNPLLSDELLQPAGSRGKLSYIANGDRFERIVRNAAFQWYNSRLDKDLGPRISPHPTANNVVSWMRHVLTTTTVNIAGSPANSDIIITEQGNTRIPHGFFFNESVIEDLLPEHIEIPRTGNVNSVYYNESRTKLGLKTIYQWDPMRVAFDHEGQTPWCVIVPSLEDRQGVNMIRMRKLLSVHELLSLLMIDFPNPVYSHRRAKLLKYVPATSTVTSAGAYTLGDSFRASIAASPAAEDPCSSESEFLHNLTLSDTEFASRIVAYMDKVAERLRTPAGVEDYMHLAESRRRIFRPYPGSKSPTASPLSEFLMTLPYATAIPQDWKPVEMTEDGQVSVMAEESQDYVKRKIAERFRQTPKQCHTVVAGSGGCPY